MWQGSLPANTRQKKFLHGFWVLEEEIGNGIDARGERIVRTSDADDGWVISAASRKFAKLGYQEGASGSNVDGYRDFTVPRSLVSFRRPRKK